MRIAELAAISKISAPTIHYYVKEGLLPNPLKTGKTMAYYTEEHVERLQIISKLKAEKKSIAVIKQILDQTLNGEDISETKNTGSSNRREDILQSAILLFREKGLHGTSITDIIQHAGAGRGTFYAYFNSKEDLFFECADQVLLEIDRGLNEINNEPDILKKLLARGSFFTNNYLKIINMINLIRGASVSGHIAFREKLDQIMKNLILPICKDLQEAMDQGLLQPTDPTLLGWMLFGTVEYTQFYFHSGCEGVPEDFPEKVWDIIINGCGKEVSSEK
jgi:AcrR family transcriptional regulator/predicted DNA-binding transcriptional regulator AlpA